MRLLAAAARQQGHAVAFFAIEGSLPVREDVRGVLRGTGRVSLENGALSFAYDPARTSANDAAQAIGKALAPHRLRISLLRVMS